MKIYLDGKFVDDAEAKVSVFDHGLLYGDGVFEGIRLYGGNIFRLDEHLERLEYSANISTRDFAAGHEYIVEGFFPNYESLRATVKVTPTR